MSAEADWSKVRVSKRALAPACSALASSLSCTGGQISTNGK